MNDPLHDRVLAYIGDPATASFDTLAIEIFERQFETETPYRRVCEQRGVTPASIRDWREIPPVPTVAFKRLTLRTGPCERAFLTTGTTHGAESRGRHELPDLRLYQASALAAFRQFVLPEFERMRMLSLIPPSSDRPESSLAQMTDWLLEAYGTPDSETFVSEDRIDFDRFADALRRCEADRYPACLLTTTGMLLRFLDYCREREFSFRLPHHSRLMDTGGDKGAPRPMSRKGLLRVIWDTLAIPGYFVVNEYGMTELSSQFYDNVIRDRVDGRYSHRTKVGPHWIRTRLLDPGTLTEATGDTGLLCHLDLANAGSVACVLTEDIGKQTPGGFDVIGRVAAAEARGCSLAAAEFVS